MRWLDRLEQKLRRYAVPNVTLGLIILQVLVYVLMQMPPRPGAVALEDRLVLVPNLVQAGEVWRLVTFLAVPPITNVLFAFLFWYFFYIMGTALEAQWGAFRYNVYLLIGYVATVAVSFLTPAWPASNGYLQGSVFLAFATLYPDFQLLLFFILPVKIKWLALLAWIGYFLTLAVGTWSERLLATAAVCNYLVFFARDIFERIRFGRRRLAVQAARIVTKPREYFHKCMVCGITDRTHPQMDFRYCSKCAGQCGYCMEHIRNHAHVVGDASARTAQ